MEWTGTRSSEGSRPLARRPAPCAALTAAAILWAAIGGAAGRAADPAASLDREIEALQKELEGLSGEVAGVQKDIETLSLQEGLARRRWMKAVAQRDRVSQQVRDEEIRTAELGRSAQTARERARAALREAYKESSAAGYASLLAVSDPSDLLRAFQSLGVVARRQGDAVTDYENMRRDSEAATADLRDRKRELEGAVAEAIEEQEALSRARASRLSLLESLEKDRTSSVGAVTELTRASDLLAGALRSLPPGAPVPRPELDMGRMQGALPWPAEGAVAVAFGSVRNPRFGTVTPHPGIEIRVPPGAAIRSVGTGRVVFSRRYGGYGRTVVIDHGGRYLSVYAHLAASVVSEGQDVGLSQELGFAQEGDAGGKTSVYFEFRYQGKALDPVEWLRRPHGPDRKETPR